MPRAARDLLGDPVYLGGPRCRDYIKPNGYAAPPGTGPAGESCKTCRFKQARHLPKMRQVYKCALNSHHWTTDRRSDILLRAPACRLWVGKA